MTETIGTVQLVDIEETMKGAYLDYAMSVITARALPDARDGLKPVQRRILYAMHDMGLRPDRPHRKCARVVGEVLGKYHPHGDSAVYLAMARMAQDFSMRYPLVDGQGNFGSVDGDSPAAMRYTEARLAKVAQTLLRDIDKNTVEYVDNFDGSLREPLVLPSCLPNLLVNGASGIAVGMATNIPPHNLTEICDALLYMVDRTMRGEEVSIDSLLERVRGPDFPTGGLLHRYRTITSESEPVDILRQAYLTGRGKLVVRAKTHTEELSRGRHAIVVTEIPYRINKSTLTKTIADLAREERVDGISDLRDESDRNGMRLVIELKRTAQPRKVLNQLFKRSALQSTFGLHIVALVDGQPQVLSLQKALRLYLEHREEVIVRRTKHELDLAERREHVLAGLRIALDNLDEIIATIRRSRTAETARNNIQRQFNLTEVQAEAILEMPLRRLAALERQKIEDEYSQVCGRIEELKGILGDRKRVLSLIRDDLEELKQTYGDPRRTRIIDGAAGEFNERDLVTAEDILITTTERGYAKREPLDTYRIQRRGGRGVIGITTRDEDRVEHLLFANTLDELLVLTNAGRVHQLNAYDIPESDRGGKGAAMIGLIDMRREERVTALIALPVEPDDEVNEGDKAPEYLVMVTRKGIVKRLERREFASVRSAGLRAMAVGEDDSVGWVRLTHGDADLLLVSDQGRAIRFNESEVRPSARSSGGVRAMRLSDGDAIAGVATSETGGELLVVTEQGYGKRTPLQQYNAQKRGGSGVRAFGTSKRTGRVIGAHLVDPQSEIALISSNGIVVRLRAKSVPQMGRSAHGARLMNVDDGDAVTSVAHVTRNGPSGEAEGG